MTANPMMVRCPTCGEGPLRPCRSTKTRVRTNGPHKARRAEARRESARRRVGYTGGEAEARALALSQTIENVELVADAREGDTLTFTFTGGGELRVSAARIYIETRPSDTDTAPPPRRSAATTARRAARTLANTLKRDGQRRTHRETQ